MSLHATRLDTAAAAAAAAGSSQNDPEWVQYAESFGLPMNARTECIRAA